MRIKWIRKFGTAKSIRYDGFRYKRVRQYGPPTALCKFIETKCDFQFLNVNSILYAEKQYNIFVYSKPTF